MIFKTSIWIGKTVLSACIPFVSCFAEGGKIELIGVAVEGVHHLGSNYSISSFYLDKNAFGNINHGGSSGTICCVTIPDKWKPGLVVEVRWGLANRNGEIKDKLKKSNYRSDVDEGAYKAIVPIEKYEEPMDLYVHFFPGGKVRVLASQYSPNSKKHPIVEDDSNAAIKATQGVKIKEIFSKKELEELIRYNNERLRKFGGWHG
ncbi:DUF3304 domain-containing protein [Pseudoduganella namucuonensis]|uniref:DUF3304 domain-containing protein n=1 Tax=Pseudoduganella namucuonensis TaxID=1035707 RepID=UPI0015A513C2|nr:DUF3304 domain-containing protein [Pseudoduganella namucuonensis]